MRRIVILFLVFLAGAIPILFHVHLVEKDFLEILGSADGLYTNQGYCFLEINNYQNLRQVTGITARPPLIQLLLTGAFKVFGHNLLAIYVVYSLPRLVIYPVLFLIGSIFFSLTSAYLLAALAFFFLFFETYAISTLKADVFVVAFSLLAILFSLYFKRNHKFKDLILATIFLGCNLLSKETASTFSLIVYLFLWKEVLFTSSIYKFKQFLVLTIIPLIMIGPFALISLAGTGRILPSLFATAFHPPSFPQNILTYIFSTFYYAGVNFQASKTIFIISVITIGLILLGVYEIVKKKQMILILPLLAALISVSLIHTRVVQGDSVGNREILHRIAYVVPFVALYIGFGIQKLVKAQLLRNGLFFLVVLVFIYRYFSAPFALDYTPAEYYVDGKTIFNHRVDLPITLFGKKDNLCITKFVPAGRFLLDEYRAYKASAFPQGYRLLVLLTWGLPLLVIGVSKKPKL